jgi:hypothetical protein
VTVGLANVLTLCTEATFARSAFFRASLTAVFTAAESAPAGTLYMLIMWL